MDNQTTKPKMNFQLTVLSKMRELKTLKFILVCLLFIAAFFKGLDTFSVAYPLFGPWQVILLVLFSIGIFYFLVVNIYKEQLKIYLWIALYGILSIINSFKYVFLGRDIQAEMTNFVIKLGLLLPIIFIATYLYLSVENGWAEIRKTINNFNNLDGVLNRFYRFFVAVMYLMLSTTVFIPFTVLDNKGVTIIDMMTHYAFYIPVPIILCCIFLGIFTAYKNKIFFNVVVNFSCLLGFIIFITQMSLSENIPDATPNGPGLVPLIISPLLLFFVTLMYSIKVTRGVKIDAESLSKETTL